MRPRLLRNIIPVLCLLVGAAFFVRLLLHRPVLPNASSTATEQDIITYSVDQPSTEKAKPTILPGKIKPTDPMYITLPTIGAEGDIVKLGVDQSGAIAVPGNIHQAGWFVNSVRPGEKGLSIINGHIDPRTNTAIFDKLHEIKIGETFEVRLGNGTAQTYIVRNIQNLPVEASAAVLFSQLPKVSYQLNLITCAGTYDQDHGLFTHRLVVAAELVR